MNSTTRGIFGTFFAKMMVSLSGLLLVVLTSRYLGAEGRGTISLMMSLIALLQLFCDFGSNSAIINLSYQVNQRDLWLSSLLWVLGICLISYLPIFFFPDIRFIFLVPAAAFLYSFINVNSLLMMGNRMVLQRNMILISSPVLLLVFFAVLFFNTPFGMASYPVALFMALLVSSVASYLILKAKLYGRQPFSFQTLVLRQGAWVQGGQALQFLNYRINFFIVAAYMGEASLGIYNNAVIISESIWMLGHSMGQMQHMKILNTADENSHIKLTNSFIVINFVGSVILMITVVCIPAAFWEWLFSKDFTGMKSLFTFLAPGVIFFSVSNIINHFLHAKNNFKAIFAANLSGLVTGLLIAVFAIPGLGLQGACLSWSGGLAASMLVYLFTYKSYLKK